MADAIHFSFKYLWIITELNLFLLLQCDRIIIPQKFLLKKKNCKCTVKLWLKGTLTLTHQYNLIINVTNGKLNLMFNML